MRLRSVTKDAGQVRLDWWPYPGLSSYRVYRGETPTAAAAFTDVTPLDPDPADTLFADSSSAPRLFYLVTGVGPRGEGAWGSFGR
jgi:hypothetical protein